MHDRTSLIYGLQPVREALKAGRRIRSLYLHRNRSGATRALVEAARSQGVQIVETSRKALSAKVGSPEHQGVVAELIGGGPGPDANASVDDIAHLPGFNEKLAQTIVQHLKAAPGASEPGERT